MGGHWGCGLVWFYDVMYLMLSDFPSPLMIDCVFQFVKRKPLLCRLSVW